MYFNIKSIFLSLCCILMASMSINAQMADGTTVPNFEAVDINGDTYNLYDLLNEGYKVVIDVSATWCGPCWDYHLTGALEDLHETYGPEGTKEVFVLFVEGDDSTTSEDLLGTGPNTYGDWTAGTPYPILDDAGFIANLLEIEYFPTIYTVCGDARIYESERKTTIEHYNFAQELNCQQKSDDVAVLKSNTRKAICETPFSAGVQLFNFGSNDVTSATIKMDGCDNCPMTQDWTGNLTDYEGEDIVFDGIESSNENVNLSFSIEINDENQSNNTAQASVNTASVESTTQWTVELLTDCYPGESSWEVYDLAGEVVASGANYQDDYTLYEETFDLPSEGCYTFVFFDSYGDGLFGTSADCTADGTIKVYSSKGDMIEAGGTDQFAELVTNSVAQSPSSIEDLASEINMTIAPNPTSDFINVNLSQVDGQNLTISLIDITGKTQIQKNYNNIKGNLNERFDVNTLSAGAYMLQVLTSESNIVKKVIIE